MALAQGAGQPSLTALSLLIQRRRKDYYEQLESANKTLDADAWLDWFADVVLAAQEHTLRGLDFLLANTRLWDRVRGQINERQRKALARLMQAGVDGFVGGLSAGKYMALTGATAATATRDLGALVELGALRRTGQLKGTRYWLPHGPTGASLPWHRRTRRMAIKTSETRRDHSGHCTALPIACGRCSRGCHPRISRGTPRVQTMYLRVLDLSGTHRT